MAEHYKVPNSNGYCLNPTQARSKVFVNRLFNLQPVDSYSALHLFHCN